MAKMGGCNEQYNTHLKNPGTKATGRMVPEDYARNGLSKGGANKDLGGGAKSPGKGKR